MYGRNTRLCGATAASTASATRRCEQLTRTYNHVTLPSLFTPQNTSGKLAAVARSRACIKSTSFRVVATLSCPSTSLNLFQPAPGIAQCRGVGVAQLVWGAFLRRWALSTSRPAASAALSLERCSRA